MFNVCSGPLSLLPLSKQAGCGIHYPSIREGVHQSYFSYSVGILRAVTINRAWSAWTRDEHHNLWSTSSPAHPSPPLSPKKSNSQIQHVQTCFLFFSCAFRISTLQYWFPIFSLKLAFGSKKTRHEEVKERPQVQHIVLYRRSRKDQSVVTDELLSCLGKLKNKQNYICVLSFTWISL